MKTRRLEDILLDVPPELARAVRSRNRALAVKPTASAPPPIALQLASAAAPVAPPAAPVAPPAAAPPVSMLTGQPLSMMFAMLRDKDRLIADLTDQLKSANAKLLTASTLATPLGSLGAAYGRADPELFTGANALLDMARG